MTWENLVLFSGHLVVNQPTYALCPPNNVSCTECIVRPQQLLPLQEKKTIKTALTVTLYNA